jgi:hypothetical protein
VVLQVDHIQPKSKGGADAWANLLTACYDCNIGKFDALLSPESIAEIVAALPPEPEKVVRQVQRAVRKAVRRIFFPPEPEPYYPGLPRSLGFPCDENGNRYSRFVCSRCGFMNEEGSDVCSCANPTPKDYFCECGERLDDELEEACWNCLNPYCVVCDEDFAVEGDYCERCVDYEDLEQSAEMEPEKVNA